MSESGRVAIDPAEGCDGEVGKVSYWISLVAKHQSYIIGNWPQLQGVPPQSDDVQVKEGYSEPWRQPSRGKRAVLSSLQTRAACTWQF